MRLDAAIERYLRHLAANGCSVHTIRSYALDFGALSHVGKPASQPFRTSCQTSHTAFFGAPRRNPRQPALPSRSAPSTISDKPPLFCGVSPSFERETWLFYDLRRS